MTGPYLGPLHSTLQELGKGPDTSPYQPPKAQTATHGVSCIPRKQRAGRLQSRAPLQESTSPISFPFQELSLGKRQNHSNPISLPSSANLIFRNKFLVHEKSRATFLHTYKDLFFQDLGLARCALIGRQGSFVQPFVRQAAGKKGSL